MATRGTSTALALLVALALCADAQAQGRGGRAGGAGPAPSARASAPEDYTGYWVSVVTEHWHLRMMVPPKGDLSMLPLNPDARKIAQSWDPAAAGSGDQCASYGAPALLRIPGRIYLHWVDDNTLQLDIDSGSQTRTFRFGAAPAAAEPSRQGTSVASWVGPGGRGRAGGEGGIGSLRVQTRNLLPGLLRKNGVPYSANATVDEYFDRFTEPNGDTWMVVTIVVTDPTYLTQPYATTVQFKKIPDRQGWDPTPCRTAEAR